MFSWAYITLLEIAKKIVGSDQLMQLFHIFLKTIYGKNYSYDVQNNKEVILAGLAWFTSNVYDLFTTFVELSRLPRRHLPRDERLRVIDGAIRLVFRPRPRCQKDWPWPEEAAQG